MSATTTQPRTRAEIAAVLADNMGEPWSTRRPDFLELADGTRVRAFLADDACTVLSDYLDCYGEVKHGEHDACTGRPRRPKGFDGAARKIDTRRGPLWWQPPAHAKQGADDLAAVEKRVRGYFLEHWSYVGVVLELERPACTCCGERKKDGASLYGIESDAGDYFADVIADLLADLGVGAES